MPNSRDADGALCLYCVAEVQEGEAAGVGQSGEDQEEEEEKKEKDEDEGDEEEDEEKDGAKSEGDGEGEDGGAGRASTGATSGTCREICSIPLHAGDDAVDGAGLSPASELVRLTHHR